MSGNMCKNLMDHEVHDDVESGEDGMKR
jgi:hypothetical protein